MLGKEVNSFNPTLYLILFKMVEVQTKDIRIYKQKECCVFRKTKEEYGGLSNMASGYLLEINGHQILSSEALYQACKFTEYPTIQKKIISEKSPMTAKMVAKPYTDCIRKDWEEIKIKVMRWCLQIKLAQNYIKFGILLEQTGKKNIVEESAKDPFWGAIRYGEELRGINALGRLLMELRYQYHNKRYSSDMFIVNPLNVVDFNILDQPIQTIDMRNSFLESIKISLNLNDPINDNIIFEDSKEEYIPNTKQEKKRSKKKRKGGDEGMPKLPF